jgi:hypothetical protein
MRSALLLMLMINMRGCSSSTAKPAAALNTLDFLESALDGIASIKIKSGVYLADSH